MNKDVITSISLLVAGVIIGVIACIVGLTTVEWQKASKANHMHANRQIAAKVSTGSGAGVNTGSDASANNRSDAKTEKPLHVAHAKGSHVSSQNFASGPSSASNSQTNSISQSNTAIDPSTRTIVPNILHQAVQTSPMQGQFVDAGMTTMAGNGMVPVSGTIQVMPTTYVSQQPVVHEIIVPGSGGPNRAVNSADAIPMPIGANGLQQNPCVDPSSSYGRAYNRGSSY